MERANVVEDGIDRLQSAFQSVEDEFEKIQQRVGESREDLEKRLRTGRKDIEKRLRSGRRDFEKNTKKLQKRVETRRKNFEKETEQRVKSWQKELRRYAIVRRVEEITDDATKRIENGVDALLGNLQIASRNDVQKIDRKLNQINRKLKSLEQERSGPAKTKKAAA